MPAHIPKDVTELEKREDVYQKGGELKNMPYPVLGPFWVELSRTPQRAGNTIGEASGSTVANVLVKDTRHQVAFVTQGQSHATSKASSFKAFSQNNVSKTRTCFMRTGLKVDAPGTLKL